MDLHALTYLLAGLAVLAMALLPRMLEHRSLSEPMVLLALGFAAFALPLGLPNIDPIAQREGVELLAEFAVLVALMGAGLKIDRRIGWRRWRSTWLLLGVTMPLTIAMTALIGWWALGVAPGVALLFAALLSPTDPVLAEGVQVGPPGEDEEESDVGFALTSEAGINDALAFPFVNAAIAAIAAAGSSADWVGEWLLVDVVLKLVIGLVGGAVIGKALGYALFSRGLRLTRYADGLAALAAVLLSYGAVEAVGGYGFLAVFVTAYLVRNEEADHEFHVTLHRFIEQIGHLSLAVVLVLLGGAVASGVLDALTWKAAGVGLALLFVVRPISGMAVAATHVRPRARAFAVAWFGIRGVGSIYYLAYALGHVHVARETADLLWATTAFVIVASIFLHGLTAPRIEQVQE